MSELYVVATPIGNLEDITLRAIRTMKEVDVLICEDTRHTKILCDKYEIDTPRVSFHARSGATAAQRLIERLRAQGETAAYVSDTGTPGVSDPGSRLVAEAKAQGVRVTPLPGASALTTLVSVAGVDRFVFLGFLPHKKGRQTMIKEIAAGARPVVLYESVHRMGKLLRELGEYLAPTTRLVVGRELTKQFEEVWEGTVAEAEAWLVPERTKGEFVVVVDMRG